MKNKIISIIQALVLLWGVTSCHSPEELGSDIQREGINSITASFPNDDSSENSFKGEIDYTNHSITFVDTGRSSYKMTPPCLLANWKYTNARKKRT